MGMGVSGGCFLHTHTGGGKSLSSRQILLHPHPRTIRRPWPGLLLVLLWTACGRVLASLGTWSGRALDGFLKALCAPSPATGCAPATPCAKTASPHPQCFFFRTPAPAARNRTSHSDVARNTLDVTTRIEATRTQRRPPPRYQKGHSGAQHATSAIPNQANRGLRSGKAPATRRDPPTVYSAAVGP